MRQCWSILIRVKRGMLEIEINWNDQTLIRKLATSTRGYLPEMVDSNPTVYDVEKGNDPGVRVPFKRIPSEPSGESAVRV